MTEPITSHPRMPPASAPLPLSKNVSLRRVSVATFSSSASTHDIIDKVSLSRRSSRNAPSRYRVVRSSSVRSVDVPLRHPTPDLQSLQGAYRGNVTRLEESAEAMSSNGGSDVGDEAGRNVNAHVRRSGSYGHQQDGNHARRLSRENSIQSSHQGEISVAGRGLQQLDTGRSRASSYANSIVDVNGSARWGGYSPGGYVNSPVGSPRSGSFPHGPTSMNRVPTSASRSSRLAQMVEPSQEGRPLDSPLAPSMSVASRYSNDGMPSRHISQGSFDKTYDQIATQITHHLDGMPPTPPQNSTSMGELHPQVEEDHTKTPVPADTRIESIPQDQGPQMHEELGAAMDLAFTSTDSHVPYTVPERPRSADTFQQAQTAFHDFDGVHFDPEAEEFVEIDNDGNEVRRVSARTSSGTLTIDPALSMLKQPPRPISMGAPPPAENMVYYPAPVPRMLNLPKRLSQLPAQHVQAKRRTQILGQMGPEAMASAPWLSQTNLSTHSAGSASGRPTSGLSGSYIRPDSKASGSHRQNGEEEDGELSGAHEVLPRPPSNLSGPHPPSMRPGSNHYSNRSGSPILPWTAHSRNASSSSQNLAANRMSIANMHNLPPQLRASAFFDHQSLPQDIEVQGESAVKTLDSILKASATAPVNAFTDHPYGGPQKDIFGREKKQRNKSSTNLNFSAKPESPETKKNKRRSRSLMGMFRKHSSGDKLHEAMKKNDSRGSVILDLGDGGKKLHKRKSLLSLSAGDELESARSRMGTPGTGTPAETPALERTQSELFRDGGLVGAAQNKEKPEAPEKSKARTVSDKMKKILSDQDPIEGGSDDEEESQDDSSEEDEIFAAPTTLLAELQVRKAQQKGRNRTAATAFPQGMHSTLLELDAVEEVSKRKRQQAKVRLAWEDPVLAQTEAAEQVEDDDVPLGMLYPNKDGVLTKRVGDERDWNRPLGLMEKRALEDNEPLSSRRNRLRGVSPAKAASAGLGLTPNGSQQHLPVQANVPPEIRMTGDGEDEKSEKDHAGETLADRKKRMHVKTTLDGAISDITPSKDGNSRPVSTFTDDVLSQFGGLEVKDGANSSRPATSGDVKPSGQQTGPSAVQSSPAADDEGETLAQRRARLAREKDNTVPGASNRPGLRSATSLANLLSANPVGQRQAGKETKPLEGTLLHTSAQLRDQQRAQLLQHNTHLGGMNQPLINSRPQVSRADLAGSTGLLANGGSGFAAAGGFQGGKFNTGIGSAGMPSSASTPYFGNSPFATSPSSYFSPHSNFQDKRWNNGMGGYNPGTGAASSQLAGSPPIMQQQQQQVNPSAYAALTGGAASHQSMMMLNNSMMGGMQQMQSYPNMSANFGTNNYSGFGLSGTTNQMNGPSSGQAIRPIGYGGGTGMPVGTADEQPLDAKQRAAIDRWRMSVV